VCTKLVEQFVERPQIWVVWRQTPSHLKAWVTAKVQKFRQLEVELGSILLYNVESVQAYSLLVNEESLVGEVARDKEMALLMQERDYLRCCLLVLDIQFRNPATMEIQNIFNCQFGALKFHSTRLGARFGVGRDWAGGGELRKRRVPGCNILLLMLILWHAGNRGENRSTPG
jgi:hypothetical protein